LIRKILLSLLVLFLLPAAFQAKSFGRKNSDSLYIYLDLKDSSKISFELSLINKIDLRGEYRAEDKSLKVKASIKDFGLNQLSECIKLPDGKLSLEASLRNVDLFKWKNLLGEGKILISEGDICQINFLKGLGKFLSIPDFEKIVFKRAYSDLFFEGEDIFFENFQLNAAQMNIEGKGKVTTIGNIDFLLFPQFSQELIDSSKGLQKYLTAFLGGAFSVSISGTIKNPVYTTNILIIPALDKIEDIVDIFKDIF